MHKRIKKAWIGATELCTLTREADINTLSVKKKNLNKILELMINIP